MKPVHKNVKDRKSSCEATPEPRQKLAGCIVDYDHEAGVVERAPATEPLLQAASIRKMRNKNSGVVGGVRRDMTEKPQAKG